MLESVYAQVAQIEDTHWWYEARWRLVQAVLEHQGLAPDAHILDVGCGTGGMLTRLATLSPNVVGLDVSPVALDLARRRAPTARLLLGDSNHLSDHVPAESFDLVTCFNVLYHEWVGDEARTLEQTFASLKPGGHVLVTEPAFPILYREHDRLGMGRKRYRLAEMKGLLERAGFSYEWGSYFNAAAFAPALLLALDHRWTSRLRPASAPEEVAELRAPPRWIGRIAGAVAGLERGYIRLFGSCPFGVSLICLGRKAT